MNFIKIEAYRSQDEWSEEKVKLTGECINICINVDHILEFCNNQIHVNNSSLKDINILDIPHNFRQIYFVYLTSEEIEEKIKIAKGEIKSRKADFITIPQ